MLKCNLFANLRAFACNLFCYLLFVTKRNDVYNSIHYFVILHLYIKYHQTTSERQTTLNTISSTTFIKKTWMKFQPRFPDKCNLTSFLDTLVIDWSLAKSKRKRRNYYWELTLDMKRMERAIWVIYYC